MKVYISYSTPDAGLVGRVSNLLMDEGVTDIAYWSKGSTYTTTPIEQSDAVIFILPGMVWEYPVTGLTHGMLSELIHCLNLKKDIYIAYKGSSGRIGIYAANISDKLIIQGLVGTSGNIGLVKHIDRSTLSEVEDAESILSNSNKYFY